MSPPGRMREVTDCGLSFGRRGTVEDNFSGNVGSCPASNAIRGHINDFLVRTAEKGAEIALRFTRKQETEIALARPAVLLPLRTTPSVS